jgi:predicted ATPase
MIKRLSINFFKAIVHCEQLPLQPFTVFIGNNGSGKSSAMEALRVLHIAVADDLQEAFSNWKGLDSIRNYMATMVGSEAGAFGFRKREEPIKIHIDCEVEGKRFEYLVSINMNESGDYFVVEHEELLCNGRQLILCDVIGNEGQNLARCFATQDGDQEFTYAGSRLLLNTGDGHPFTLDADLVLFREYVLRWQFLYLDAHEMGEPCLQNRLTKKIRLSYNGRNIAEYLVWLKAKSPEDFNNILRKMSFVLPYMQQIQPRIADMVSREIDLTMHEQNDKGRPLPGWLLSSGTLRILALLAMFNNPEPPSALFIDEVENGLDPRTIGLLLSEIENVFHEKSMQVVVTTHSPYFLDQVPLESIIVAEKDEIGSIYHIPKDEANLKNWKDKFSPGKLYTMGKLTK